MELEENNNAQIPEENKLPPAPSGNTSNPSEKDIADDANSNQLLDKKAEKYLREVASIEDVPDAQDQQDMDDTIKKESD